jgi:hypothetical protein
LILATFKPALMSSVITSTESEEGPNVDTILARLGDSDKLIK